MIENIKLAIVTTHPIQYYAPVFKMLAETISVMVFYTERRTTDRGFQKKIDWDVPLFEGYSYKCPNTSLNKEIAAYNPDQILVYGWATIRHLNVLRDFKGKKPILFRGDSTLLAYQGWLKDFIKRTVLKAIYKHVDKALYVGQNNKVYFLKYGLKERQLIFVPHSVDNHRFATPADSDLRKNLGLKRSDILILFAAKFQPIKNPELLLLAFQGINLPNIHLLFVGDGKLKPRLIKLSKSTRNVHFLPFQNQSKMPGVYQACDLFCLPSNGDSWGLSVNEAMAAGKAILVSDKVGSAADLVTEENGRIFKHNNLKDLKVHLIALLSDRISLRDKGLSSSQKIIGWSFEMQIKQILSAISR